MSPNISLNKFLLVLCPFILISSISCASAVEHHANDQYVEGQGNFINEQIINSLNDSTPLKAIRTSCNMIQDENGRRQICEHSTTDDSGKKVTKRETITYTDGIPIISHETISQDIQVQEENFKLENEIRSKMDEIKRKQAHIKDIKNKIMRNNVHNTNTIR